MMHIKRWGSNEDLSFQPKHGHGWQQLRGQNLRFCNVKGYAATRFRSTLIMMCCLVLAFFAQTGSAQLAIPIPGPSLPPPGGIIKLPPINTPTPGGLIHIEAEAFTLTGYRVENNTIASGKKLISLRNPSSPQESPTDGTASIRFGGQSGSYTVIVNHLDEDDGSAQLGLEIDGKEVDSWTLDQALGSGNPETKPPFTARKLGTFFIDRGKTVTLSGSRDANENARVDFVQFIPVGSNPAGGAGHITTRINCKDESGGFHRHRVCGHDRRGFHRVVDQRASGR